MIKTVQVTFRGNTAKTYDFYCDMAVKIGDDVLLDTTNGLSIGKVAGIVDSVFTKADHWVIKVVGLEFFRTALLPIMESDLEDQKIKELFEL